MERLRDIDYGAPDTQAGRSLQSIHTAPHVRMGSAPSPNAMVRCPWPRWPTCWRDVLALPPPSTLKEPTLLAGASLSIPSSKGYVDHQSYGCRRVWGHDLVL